MIKREIKASPRLITIEEATQIFKVSKPTIHNWINIGIVVRRKLGRRSYIDLDHAYKSMGIINQENRIDYDN